MRRNFILLNTLTALLVLLAFLAVAVSFSYLRRPPITQQAEITLGEKIRNGTAEIPAISTSTKKSLETHPTFQAIISFTDHGFEPRNVTINRGDTVRFTNNSSVELWVAATSGRTAMYNDNQKHDCGSSSLDSCYPPIQPQDFWQFTFLKAGEWSFINKVDNKSIGTVRVQ